MDYIRKETPPERGDEHSSRKKRERERERERAKDHSVKISPLLINERSILGPTLGRVYTELLLFSFILTALVLLVLSL